MASCHLLPSLYHQLTLLPTSDKYLKWLHRTGAAVRSWLKLPNDSVTAYFHSAVVDGGVNVPMLAHQVPLMKVDSEDPAIQALLVTPAARQLIESQTRPRQLNDTVVTSTRCLRSALAHTLYQSVDGRGLVDVSLVPQQHLWVSFGTWSYQVQLMLALSRSGGT